MATPVVYLDNSQGTDNPATQTASFMFATAVPSGSELALGVAHDSAGVDISGMALGWNVAGVFIKLADMVEIGQIEPAKDERVALFYARSNAFDLGPNSVQVTYAGNVPCKQASIVYFRDVNQTTPVGASNAQWGVDPFENRAANLPPSAIPTFSASQLLPGSQVLSAVSGAGLFSPFTNLTLNFTGAGTNTMLYRTDVTWWLNRGTGSVALSSNFSGDFTANWNDYNIFAHLSAMAVVIRPKDTTPPTGLIVINNNDAYAPGPNVTLTLAATDDISAVTQMQFSNNGSTWTTAETYATTKAYTLPTGDGSKTVYVRFKDAEGNWSGAFSDSIVLDENPPTGSVLINGVATHTNLLNVTLTLSASDGLGSGVTQMLVSNDMVFNEPWETYATTKAWTLDATGGDGVKTVFVLCRDLVGHMAGAITDTIILDRSLPGCTVSTAAASPTNAQPIPFTITFTEPVTGFVSTDITVTNGDVASFSGGPTVYDITVTPTELPPTTVSVSVGQDVAQDYATNLNTASNTLPVVYDNAQPTCAVAGPASPTPTSPIVFTIQFNKPMSGLLASEILVSNGTPGALSGGGTTYLLPVTPIAQGDVTCQVPGGVAEDSSSNPNQASNEAHIVYDSIPPSCTVSGPLSPTKADPIVFTLTFDEDVTGLIAGEITVLNGTPGALSGSGTTYTLPVTPAGQGAVTCQVPADAAQDAAGNGNTLSNNLDITYDTEAPSCTVGGPASPTNANPITFTITFNEDVTGLIADAIVVTGGDKGALSGSGRDYTLPVTPTGDGAVFCQVAATSAYDGAGNASAASNNLSITYDSQAPSCTVTSPPSPTRTSPIEFTITFSEVVTELTADNIVVTNGTKGVLAGSGTTYTLPVTPTDQGLVTCQAPAAAVRDLAGNDCTASNIESVVFDSEAPACTVTGPVSPTQTSPIVFTITFSEDATGLTEDAVVVTNGTKGTLTGGGTTYTLPVTPSGQGSVTCQVSADSVQDQAGNGNAVSNDLSIVYDTVSPTCVVTGPPSPVTGPPLVVTLTFDEAMTGLDKSEIAVTNATADILTTSDQIVYSLTLVPLGTGDVTCQVPAAVATDVAGNDNEASNLYTVLYDSERPSCTVSSVQAPATRVSPIAFTLTFSENVTDLRIAEVRVTGGYRNSLSGSGAVYTLTVDPINEGPVTCQVPENVAESADVGNPNTESNTLQVNFDLTPPSCTVTGPPSPTNADPILFTITFDEAVVGLVADTINVTNGTKGPLTGDGITFTLPVVPTDPGDVTCTIGAGAAQDLAGNDNTASNLMTVLFDNVRPTCTVTPPAGPVHMPPIAFTIEFSEPVTDLTLAGLSIENAIPESLTGTGAGPYTLTVTPLTMGLVTCQALDGAVQDTVGNPSVASNQGTVYYDNPNPSCLVTTTTVSPTKASPIVFDIHFLVPVTGLEADEIIVANGVKGALTGSGKSYSLPVTPSAQGPVTCTVPDGAAQDGGGLGNTASNVCSVVYDTVAPTAVLTLDGSTPTTDNVLLFIADFNENVGTSFTAADVTATGSLAGLASITQVTQVGNRYTVRVTLSDTNADGTVGIQAGTAVSDLAGNAYESGVSPLYTVRNWFGFAQQPGTVYTYSGSSVQFSIGLNPHGQSMPTYQWWFDDEGSLPPVPVDGATTGILAFPSVLPENTGDYWCVVSYFGKDFYSNQGILSVNEHLAITNGPIGGSYEAWQTHTFDVLTTGGAGQLTYQWFKDGDEILGATESSFTIHRLEVEDAGYYSIQVSDSGTDVIMSDSALLSVDASALPAADNAGLAALVCAFMLLGVVSLAGKRRRQ